MRNAIKNGEIIKESECLVPITARAVQYSFSVYEALRVIGGKVVHLEDHLARLKESADAISLKLSASDEEITLWLDKLIKEDNIVDATVRILALGGDVDTIFITHQDLLTYPDSYYIDGIDCGVYYGERFLPYAKTSNLLMSYIALESAKEEGNFESLLINRKGLITEGTRSNFYAISENRLYTADDSLVLSGITRISVLRAAKELGMEIILDAPSFSEIYSFDGAFISSTSMAAMPIATIDGRAVSQKSHDTILKIRDLVRAWELE